MKSDEPIEMTVKIKEGKYFISIPEEDLVASGEDWDSAYQALMSKAKSVKVAHQKMSGGGIGSPALAAKQETDPQKTPYLYDQMRVGGVVPFFLKTLFVVVAVLIVVSFSSNQLDRIISSNISNVSREATNVGGEIKAGVTGVSQEVKAGVRTLKGMKPGLVLEKELYRAVDHPITPERQSKIIKSIRILVKRLRPFVKELQLLFVDEGGLVEVDK